MFMVSPWQANGDLMQYLKVHTSLDRLPVVSENERQTANFLTRTVLYQVRQVADALLYLHSNKPKIIHGDIKGVSFTYDTTFQLLILLL